MNDKTMIVILFKDGTYEVTSDFCNIHEANFYYSYLDDCGNYLVEPSIDSIYELNSSERYKDCAIYKDSLCEFIGFKAPSILVECNKKLLPECSICPCVKNR